MLTHFVCLANSLKEGGRCLAGIELDSNNLPVFVNGMPKWIRPVCTTEHGEVPIDIAIPFDLLDIIEIEITELRPAGYQTENVFFNQKSLIKSDVYPTERLSMLCDKRSSLFGNKGKAVSEELIQYLDHSLVLLNVHHFDLFEKIYPDRPRKPQLRIAFEHKGTMYDLPVTDPMFRDAFNLNKNILKEVNQIYICVSLGIMWEGWYHKLCAGIIY